VLGLIVDDPGATPIRPTDDVDLVVNVESRTRYDALSKRLLELGFHPDTSEDAPLCRWLIEDVVVDVMPSSSGILGFSNRWYADAITHSTVREIEPGVAIRVATAPYLIAMKLDAFAGRGDGDYVASHDVEDIVAIVDGRATLVDEISRCHATLREHLADAIRALLDDDAFVAALPGHLAGDAASQARLPIVLGRLQRIADRPSR